jgi:hypothetical protein
MSIATEDHGIAMSADPERDLVAAVERHEQRCPVCHRDDGLWIAKGGHWQVWHPTRLFPCGAHTL